jgi:hypothetical protein
MTLPRKGNGNRATKTILLLLAAPFVLAAVGLGVVSIFQPLAWQRLKNHVGSEVERYRCEFDPVCITASKEQELEKSARVKVGEFMQGLELSTVRPREPIAGRRDNSTNDLSPAAVAALISASEMSYEASAIMSRSAKLARSGDISGACRGGYLASRMTSRIFAILTPHAREIQLKRPRHAKVILSAAENMTANLSASMNKCKRMGY